MAKRTWFRDTSAGKPICYPGRYNDCYKPHFLLSDMQQDDAQAATEEINRVLDGLSDSHPDLAILGVGEFLLLMEVEHREASPSDVTADSEEEVIWEALSIRREQQP